MYIHMYMYIYIYIYIYMYCHAAAAQSAAPVGVQRASRKPGCSGCAEREGTTTTTNNNSIIITMIIQMIMIMMMIRTRIIIQIPKLIPILTLLIIVLVVQVEAWLLWPGGEGGGTLFPDTLKPSLVARSAVPDSRRSGDKVPPPSPPGPYAIGAPAAQRRCWGPVFRAFGCREQPKSAQGCLERAL